MQTHLCKVKRLTWLLSFVQLVGVLTRNSSTLDKRSARRPCLTLSWWSRRRGRREPTFWQWRRSCSTWSQPSEPAEFMFTFIAGNSSMCTCVTGAASSLPPISACSWKDNPAGNSQNFGCWAVVTCNHITYIISHIWSMLTCAVCADMQHGVRQIFSCVLKSLLSFSDRSSLKGSGCCKTVMTKAEQKPLCPLFQTMEIRTPMLQIRRTSHRNSFYGSGKRKWNWFVVLTFTLWVTLLNCECVFVPLDHRKATSLPHHHPFGLFLGRS